MIVTGRQGHNLILVSYSSSRIFSTSSPAPNNDAIKADIHPGIN
jgi:hypothetical protein